MNQSGTRTVSIGALGGAGFLLIGALVPDARPAMAVFVACGWGILTVLQRPAALGWAAVLPLSIALMWPWLLGVDRPIGPLACADPLSVIALRRVAIALVVGVVVIVLVRIHRSQTLFDLGLRRPRPHELALAVVGLVVVALGGLLIGPWLAEPFFGRVEFERPIAALLPAVAFGVANGILEETAYRGALQGWLGRVAGPWVGVVVQAIVFGIVHVGPDVTAFVPVHATLLAMAGLLAGVYVRQSGSLAVPIGVHIGADIALYYGLACRVAV